MKWLFNLIFKKVNNCPHGYPISSDENVLPHKRTIQRIEVCKECALGSALEALKID
jgi:hypothetical protein